MIKKLIPLILAAIAAIFISYGCNMKTTVTTWGPTETNTPYQSPTISPTITVTCTATQTITPGATLPPSHFYYFETGTDGWSAGSPLNSDDAPGVSVEHSTNSLCIVSSGSLRLNADYTLTGLNAIARIDLGGEENLEYRTVSATVYIPAGMITVPYNSISLYLAGINTSYLVMSTPLDLTAGGCWDLYMYVPPDGGSDNRRRITEIGVIIMKNAGGSLAYTGPIYIDNVSW